MDRASTPNTTVAGSEWRLSAAFLFPVFVIEILFFHSQRSYSLHGILALG
jgi:hypothetical protein